ncbi:MAG: hypothetical protein IJ661_10920 [Lachnospiraceae bacterium]|nr:hypothetical protein [Lachnospiraceae bacterium]
MTLNNLFEKIRREYNGGEKDIILVQYIPSNIFPYYVGKFRNDNEYLDMTNKIFLILDDGTIIEYRNSDFDSKGTYCMYFE